MTSVKDTITQGEPRRSGSLLQSISDLFDGKASSVLPAGIEKIERATIEAVRVRFEDKIDEELLARIAVEEGYVTEKGSFALRVVKDGAIVARAGSRSDVGGRFDLYIYLFPPEMGKISVYRKVVAHREGILEPSTSKVSFENLYRFNLNVITLVSRYIEEKYGEG